MDHGSVAVVILAHDQPVHLRRFIWALEPFTIFIHIDANASKSVYLQMSDDLPERVHLLPRRGAGWARPELVEAEFDGYRAALTTTSAKHIIVATGSDYPLASPDEIVETLDRHTGHTLSEMFSLPRLNWPPLGGLDRFIVPQSPRGRSRRITGGPRLLPRGVRPAGGSQHKIIARDHASRVLGAIDSDPDLWHFLATCWIPDEVAVPTLLRSKQRTGVDWSAAKAHPLPWFIDWGVGRAASPRWLNENDFDSIAQARAKGCLFARKFSQESGAVLDRIERELW